MLSIYLLNYPSFYKHLIPSHRQARAPVILLYFEELREVATRLSKASVYYITADKIERVRKTGWEQKRERGRKVFCCAVIRLSCCWPQRGTAEFKMQVAVNRVSFLCCCVSVFMFLYACSDAAIENLSGRALGEVQEEAKCSHVSNVPGLSSSVSFPQWQVRYDCYQHCKIKPDTSYYYYYYH